jgi:uncharacterized caspase-like protein/TPR repeat protein
MAWNIRAWLAAIVVTAMAVATAHAQPERRVALLIGNSAYSGGMPVLTYPLQDTRALEQSLKKLNFEVQVVHNADQKAMGRAIRDFGSKAREAQIAMVYYSGHGMQARDENYLIPVGAAIETEGDLDIEAIQLRALMRQIEDARPKTTVVVLDACRDNPVASRTKSAAKGLSRVQNQPGNTLVVYAAQPGATATDNGIFARELARHIAEPNISLRTVFDRVGQAVRQASDQKQIIQRDDQLSADVVLSATQPPAAQPDRRTEDNVVAELRARTATDKRWVEEFTRAELAALSDGRMQSAMQDLVKAGNAIAAAELLADWPTPDDGLTAKAIQQLAPLGLAAMQRLADERHPVALRWMAKIYLRGDSDLKVTEDNTRGSRLLDAALRVNEPGALWLQTGYTRSRDERIRLLTVLSKTGKNRYACLAMVGAQWQDPGDTKVMSLAFSGPERRIKSFLAYRTGASYSAVGYPMGRTAVEWTTRAFEMGCEMASAFSVGHAHDPFTEAEPGVPKDARRALDWYQRSTKQGEEVGGWVPYRLFVLHALGHAPVAADPQKARNFLERIFQVEEPEPWGLIDDLLQNPRLMASHLREFLERYVRWMLPSTKSPADVAFVANEAKRLLDTKTSQGRTAARALCTIAADLKNEPCRKWLAEN